MWSDEIVVRKSISRETTCTTGLLKTMKYSLFTVILPELSPEKIVIELKKAGYDAVEWRIHPDYHFPLKRLEEKAVYIKKITEDAGLAISNLGSYASVFDTKNIKKLISAAHKMGAPSFRACMPTYQKGKEEYHKLKAEVRESLEKVKKDLKDSNIKLLIELHHGTIVPSASAAATLLEGLSCKQYGVIYDPGNMIIEGREEWSMGLEILSSYLAYVHVKNTGWVNKHGEWQKEWLPLSKGMVNWKKILQILKYKNYQGFLSIENLYNVPLTTSGLVKESLKQKCRPTSWQKRIKDDMIFLKGFNHG
ncbi:MAG: sugar phosphate isomerase/epimerase [Elusimicrobia bacterium]|nr:sugar phosphate isomerase/epimerase [Elusimicrobiota bacterium]